jgi:hypothetical protein
VRRSRGRRLPVDAGGSWSRAILSRTSVNRVVPRSRIKRVAPGGAPSHYTLSSAELVGAVCGLGLLVASFLPWYSTDGVDATAWEAFTVIDLVLVATAISAISVAAVVFTRLSVSYPPAGSAVTTGLGVAAVVCVLFRLIDPPADGVDPAIGAWLGLVAAVGVTVGGYLGMQEP